MRTRLTVLPFLCLFAAVAAAQDSSKLNEPPEGYVALFNGQDLAGWIGHSLDPKKLREMPPDERTGLLEKNWDEVEQHWSVENGELVNDGHGPYLTTAKDYGDFELLLEYKTVAKADSGIYLRGVPQVQIWDTTEAGGKKEMKADKGSGGLFNNQKTPNTPLVLADKPFGEWNTFRIRLVGDSVTVLFNDKLVVNEQPLENYWDRENQLYPVGPIQLQTHGGEIRFRNVFLKEIPRKPPEAGYLAEDGTPYGDEWKEASAAETNDLRNFDMHATFKLEGDLPAEALFRANGGEYGSALVLTVSPEHGILLSDRKQNDSDSETSKPYTIASTPLEASGFKKNESNHLYLRVEDDHIQAWLNATPVIDTLYAHGPESGAIDGSGAHDLKAYVRNLATDTREEMPAADEVGFEAIFNGQDLSGWTGDVTGYAAEPNVLKSKPGAGGNLFYESELTDFVFRFEFKLDEGGNNGVGLRAPLGRDAAYAGMESQILDNTSEQYATIQPYQAHGSIYGIVPAKRGYLAPVGHWNQQEIVLDGSHVKVTLNGKVIIDADLEEASKDGTPDHKEHPGLKNQAGHLGFLGHGHEIVFRNLRLKRLNAE
ncbi:MAG: DUF1080 domain-containing protein [Planctomycetota bacterium]|nr:DUF1080 domain-containing protein [Planctomycetota bacterium]